MTAAEALIDASGRGVALWTEGGELRFRAPPGVLDDALRGRLRQHKGALVAALPGPEGRDDRWHPLSGTQRGMWFFHSMDPGSPAYHLPFAATVDGPFDADAFVARFEAAVQHHEILRTTFPSIDGAPVQRVRPRFEPSVAVEAAGERSDEALWSRLRTDLLAPFDLAAGPLVRLRILRRAAERHVVALCLHHAVADLSSMSLLLDELVGGRRTAPEVGYGAFAREQQARHDDPAGWEHWRRRLQGADWDLPLPVDRRPPDEPDDAGGTLRFALPVTLAAELSRTAASREVTLYSLLLASFGVLLQRYSGQADLLIGAPLSGRFDRRFAHTLGPFVDVVPLRLEVDPRKPFSEVLAAAHDTVSDAMGHAGRSFAALVRRLAPPRDARRTSTLRALFAWQSLDPDAPAAHRELVAGELGRPARLGAAMWTPQDMDPGAVVFDLAVTAAPSKEGIAVALEYREALFEEATIARLAANWTALLEDVAAGREAPRAVTEAERARLVGPLARGTERRPRELDVDPRPLAAQLETRLREAPERIACRDPHGPITYGELATAAGALAARLPAGRRIGLLAEPGRDQLAGLVAILRAGSAFVPLAGRDPVARQGAMLDDAGVEVVVASPAAAPRARQLGREVIVAGDGEPAGPPPPVPSPDPERLVYVAFTSGTTGRPKGVPITERNLAPVLAWGLADLGLGPHTRVLQNLSLAFDFGIFEALTTLLAGGVLCVPDPTWSLDGILDFAEQEGADTLHTTPSWARLLLSAGRPLPTLRTAHFGGEVLALPLVERLLAAMPPDGRVFNGYGPTEATINCTVARFDRRTAPALRRLPSVPIGAPVAPFRLYVLDGRGEPAPLGGRGELHIGGPCVASGYLGRPDAPAFGEDPFEPGGRLYRTGDVARMTDSGELLFCGRRDRQVQLRGRRVELAEIEAVLAEHPGVAEAAVDVRTGPGGARLVAWVQAASALPAPDEFLSWAASRLPAAMIPSRIVEVADLPRGRAGKVDRAALREPPRGPSEAAASPPVRAGGGGVDAEVLAAFRDVLREPALTADDEFFEYGDSLLAVELAHRLGRRLGRDVPGDALFRASTPAALAALLARPAPAPPGLLELRPGAAGPPLFVVPPGELELAALRDLADLLPLGRAVLALAPAAAPGLGALLERYADAITAAQPRGPLHLLGYCVGGQIAFELGRTLESRGREVAWVVLVDSPFRESRLMGLAWRALRWLARRWAPSGGSRVARYTRGLFLDPGVDAHSRALAGHRPRPWRGRVVYLMARWSHLRLGLTRRRWAAAVSPELEFGWLPGDHDSCLGEPHVRALADRLGELLAG